MALIVLKLLLFSLCLNLSCHLTKYSGSTNTFHDSVFCRLYGAHKRIVLSIEVGTYLVAQITTLHDHIALNYIRTDRVV